MIKSFKDRIKSRLGISAAELGDPEKLQVATLGVSVVSGDSGVCHEMLTSVRTMGQALPDAILADFRSQVIAFGKQGQGLDPIDESWGADE